MKNTISNDPTVYTIENFISDEDCDHLINISDGKIKQALVSGDKKGYVSTGRTGGNYWLMHNYDEITMKVANNISKILQIPLENAEAFQIIHYNETQEYRNHYDGWSFDNSEKSKRNMKHGGQRMVTALCYLNEVEKGGGTKFTKLNKLVHSEKGKLLVFSNVYEGTNIKHKLSEHCGMPVIKGEKWAFNLWFREQSRNILYDYSNLKILKIDKKVGFKEKFLTSEETNKIIQLCVFDNTFSMLNNDIAVCWIKNNTIPEIINKIEKETGLESEYFENMRVAKYKKGISHKDHFDAYDLDNPKALKYIKKSGQRLVTITGFLSTGIVTFPKLLETYECKNGSMIYYNNCNTNSNIRNLNYIKNYNSDEDMIIFNIYVREIINL
jgi:prolyl 4-hydroxylase